MIKRLILAAILLPYIVPIQAQVAFELPHRAGKWICYQVVDGEEIEISRHNSDIKATAACQAKKIFDLDGDYRVKMTGYLEIVINSDAAAQVLSIPASDPPPENELPAGWSETLIDGGVRTINSSSLAYETATGRFTITHDGGEIWNTTDHFRAATYQIASLGDVTYTACLLQSHTGTGAPNPKAPIQLRETLNANAAAIYLNTIGVDGANGIRLSRRASTGAAWTNTYQSNDAVTLPEAFRFEVDGALGSWKAYVATSCTSPSWVEVEAGTETYLDTGDTVYLVLAATVNDAADVGYSGTAIIDSVVVDTATSVDHSAGSTVDVQPTTLDVNEDAGTFPFVMNRAGGLSGSCSIDWNITGGSCLPGTHYTDTSGTITFADGVGGTNFTGSNTISVTNIAGPQQGGSCTIIVTATKNTCPDTLGDDTLIATWIDKDQPQNPPFSTQDASGCSDGLGAFDAFIPGVRGFGSCNRGGFVQNTNVIVVENTNSSGAGSLADALDAACPKVILFGVAGLITLTDGDVNNCNNWSIVGASAPGNVAVTGATGPQLLGRGNNWTIDHMIFAPQDASGTPGATGNRDAFDFKRGDDADNALLLNNAFLWGTDEVATCYNASPDTSTNITFWQNVVGAGLTATHNYGMLLAGTCDDISIIRNLFVHLQYRNPEARADNVTMSNNIIHNRGIATYSATPCNTPGANVPKATDTNFVGNIDIRGPQRSGNDAMIAYTFPDGQCFSHQAHVNNNAYETGSTGAIQNCGLNECTSGSIGFNGGGYQPSVIAAAWPPGYVRETVPTTAADIETFGKNLLSYIGPRPNSRLTYVSTLIGEAENGLDQVGSQGSWPTSMASEGGVSAITPTSSSYDPTDAADNPCAEDMPTGATANAIQSSGLTRLHEWVIGCFYDDVMPAGYREGGLQNYPISSVLPQAAPLWLREEDVRWS